MALTHDCQSAIHRLHLLHMFDTIYLFKRGRIVASGTLEELEETSQEFRELWRKYEVVHKHE